MSRICPCTFSWRSVRAWRAEIWLATLALLSRIGAPVAPLQHLPQLVGDAVPPAFRDAHHCALNGRHDEHLLEDRRAERLSLGRPEAHLVVAHPSLAARRAPRPSGGASHCPPPGRGLSGQISPFSHSVALGSTRAKNWRGETCRAGLERSKRRIPQCSMGLHAIGLQSLIAPELRPD